MRTTEEIYQEMLGEFSRRAGYLPGESCDLAVRMYAMAAQVEALYAQAEWVMAQSFPQTAVGTGLDYHGQTRGITRNAPAAAEGTLRFFVDTAPGQALDIPQGTVCMTAGGLRFITTQPGTLAPGALTADVPARAVEPGSQGNVGPGLVILMAVPPAGILRCTNPAAFAGGADEEDDDALRRRILDSYRRLPNGANAAFYEQAALSVPGVAAACAVGRARGIGTVDVYAAGISGAPDEALLEQIHQVLQEKREIAVDVKVLAAVEDRVDVTAQVTPAAGFTAEEACQAAEAALRGYFTGALLSRGVTLAELGNLFYRLESVANYAITAPAADVPAQAGRLPVLGAVQIRGAQ